MMCHESVWGVGGPQLEIPQRRHQRLLTLQYTYIRENHQR